MATTYHFSGVVHPIRSAFALPETRKLGFTFEEEGLTGTAELQIFYSHVSVVAAVDGDPNVGTLKNVVHALIQATVDAYGYLSGRGFRAEVVSVLTPDGNLQIFGCGVPILESTAESRPLDIESVLTLSYESRWVRRMLTDLSLAIREPADSGFYLYRAIEAIRQHFREQSPKESDSWASLRNELRIKRESLDEIKSFADPSRHGDWAQILDEESARILSLGWEIAFRFCRHLLGTSMADNDDI